MPVDNLKNPFPRGVKTFQIPFKFFACPGRGRADTGARSTVRTATTDLILRYGTPAPAPEQSE